jgi:pimeloyl-ACP methyl ester carboxylesterase
MPYYLSKKSNLIRKFNKGNLIMWNHHFFSRLFCSFLVVGLITGLLFLSYFSNNVSHSTLSVDQSPILDSALSVLPFKSNKVQHQEDMNSYTQIQDVILDVTNNPSNQNYRNSSFSIFQEIDNISSRKVRVGDIDINYKIFGNGEPLLLISGSGNVMDVWPSHLLQELAKLHKVIIFDNRGVGNTTSGINQFSVEQFSKDTVGLLQVLKIEKVDVLGFSMGSFVAQKLVLDHPDKISKLILYGASCGGHEGISQDPQVVQTLTDFVNNKTNNISSFLEVTFPAKWMKENPNFLQTIPKASEIISPITMKKQFEINEQWLSRDWSGVCEQLKQVTIPTLVLTGTDDQAIPSANSLVITEKIPGAWLVQVKGAGHGLMYQYPELFANIIQTFLNQS